jgi:hypothetical protein
MGIEGRLFEEDDIVFFGKPLEEKAFEALKKRSPTANSIIKSLPKSAFIPIQEEELVGEIKKEEIPEAVIDRKKARIERKKLRKQNRKTNLEKTIQSKKEASMKMDLEKELELLEQEITPKETPVQRGTEVPQTEEAPQMKDQILLLLEGEEDAPSEEMIAAWKERYGKNGIHVMAFGEGDVYIYHHLTRGEWKKIKDLMNKLRESSDPEEVEEKLKEKVVLYCTLYPSVDERWLEYCKAGVLDSLYQMILLNSGFLTPQQAMLLTTQL